MLKSVLSVVVLFAIWCLLSGHYNALLLILGVISCWVSYYLYLRVVRSHGSDPVKLNASIPKLIVYFFWLIAEIVKSSFAVLQAVFDTRKISPQFFEVDTEGLDEMQKVIYANSITLTPGTVSTHLENGKIRVHALTDASREDLQTNIMRNRIDQII